jgi:hypothetical protein
VLAEVGNYWPSLLAACYGGGEVFWVPAVVRSFGWRALVVPEVDCLCAPAYPRPFAGREEGRQGKLRQH